MVDDDPRRALVGVLSTLTGSSAEDAWSRLAAPSGAGSLADPFGVVERAVRLAPVADHQRTALLGELVRLRPVLEGAHLEALQSTARSLRVGPLFPPPDTGPPVTLPPLPGELDAAFRVLFDLDREDLGPWTLVGGLMVMTHAVQADVAFSRTTVDADIVVDVFTHRAGLARLTRRLLDAGLADVTPEPLTGGPLLSYRWRRSDGVAVDVVVPPRANDQRATPRAHGGRPSVEIGGVQQALSRTRRVPVLLSDATAGSVRRPDLLGAVVLKSVALVTDRRDPRRHAEDLVVLGDAMAREGAHVELVARIGAKDSRRVAVALQAVGVDCWRSAADPDAARAALDHLARSGRAAPDPPPAGR